MGFLSSFLGCRGMRSVVVVVAGLRFTLGFNGITWRGCGRMSFLLGSRSGVVVVRTQDKVRRFRKVRSSGESTS